MTVQSKRNDCPNCHSTFIHPDFSSSDKDLMICEYCKARFNSND